MTEVQHQAEQHRFVIPTTAEEAVLDYHLFNTPDGKGAVDFTHTWVPPSMRGQGLAERLVREGLRWAKAEGLTIRASCWYAAKFLRD